MKKTKFKMAGNGSGMEDVSEPSCLCASVLKKDAGTVEGDFNTETQRLKGTGFKMTEIGLIPEDWEVKRIGDIGQVVTGSTPPRNNSANWGGDFNWISAKDFNGKYISKTEEHITEAGKRFCRLLPEDSVLVTCIASIGLNAISKKACATNQQINAVVCRVDSPEYLYYQICYRNGDLKLLAGQTAVPIIGKKQFEDVLISLPPLHEQKKIAEALSDVDELLAAMTTLIEKKRAIKQGAMQELLGIRNEELGMRNCGAGAKKEPRRRLPGFSGEWKIVRIGEISKLVNGYAFKSETYTDDGQFSIITIANVQDGKFILESVNKINDLPNDIQGHQILHKGDVIISMTGNVGRVCRVTQEKCLLNQRVGKFESIEIDTSFFYLSLRTKRFISTMIDKGQGGAQPNIGKYDISSYEIMVPPTLAEQRAIAEVLSDMDAEIEALEAKRAKHESIKQGMMQELLTGKTRLKGA